MCLKNVTLEFKNFTVLTMLIMQGNEFSQATSGTSERHITWDDDPWAENLFEKMELDEVCLCTCFVQKK